MVFGGGWLYFYVMLWGISGVTRIVGPVGGVVVCSVGGLYWLRGRPEQVGLFVG